MVTWLDNLLLRLAVATDSRLFDVNALVALGLVGWVCGLVGSLVVGNRMAFFSDAMAHCAFAGAALGTLSLLIADPTLTTLGASQSAWVVQLVMVLFGGLVGVGIAFFRERSGLTADSVIGVFFAMAVGFGAMLLPGLSRKVQFNAELFLFGSPLFATAEDLVPLAGLAVVTTGFVALRYNALVFASFNPSLARSRGIGTRLNSYLFIILLSLVVNLSIKAVGVVLINALLVVPAAAAANVSGNLRRLFAVSLGISFGSAVLGYLLSSRVRLPVGEQRIELQPSGTIIVLAVACFFATAAWAALRKRRVHGADG